MKRRGPDADSVVGMNDNERALRWNRGRALLFCCSLVLMIFITYGQVTHNQFVDYDDFKYVNDNHVLNGLTLESIRYAFTNPVDANWIPVTLLSHMLDVELFGGSPVASHTVNLILHCMNAVLLWLLLRRLTGADARSAVVAAIFALHPLRVESVAWAAERKDVLSACFCLLTLHAYLGYTARPGLLRYLIVAACFVTGLLAKPMMVTIPIILLLLDFWPLGRLQSVGGAHFAARWRLVAEKLPLLVPVVAVSLITLRVQDQGGALNEFSGGALYSNVTNAAVSLIIYLRQLFFPAGLTVFYPTVQWANWQWLGSLLILALVTHLVAKQQHRQYLLFGWLWYLVTILPVIGLVRIGTHSHADRYTHIPLIGVTVMIVWLIADLLKDHRRLAALAVAFSIAACTALTYRQVSYWKDSYTLYHRALDVTSNNWLAHNNLAVLHLQWGQLPQAEQHLSEALRIRPDYDDALVSLGLLRKIQNRSHEAGEAYRHAVETNPRSVKALYRLGTYLISNGDLAGGEAVRMKLAPLDSTSAAALDDMLNYARSHRN